jgi:hypothetical protein
VVLLLNFAENNDNMSAGSAGGRGDGDGEEGDMSGASRQSFNDGQYCALLMLCLSQVQLAVVPNPALPPGEQRRHHLEQKDTIVDLLQRIIAVSTYFLHREQIMLACLADDGSAEARPEAPPLHASFVKTSGRRNPTLDARRGLLDRHGQASGGGGAAAAAAAAGMPRSHSPGGGMVASCALQCICNAEIQLSRVLSNNPSNGSVSVSAGRSHDPPQGSTPAEKAGAGRGARGEAESQLLESSGTEEPFKFDYDAFMSESRWPSQVRSSAIDAKVRS